MSNNYFITSALPEIKLTEPPEISFYQFVTLLKMNLSLRDYEKVEVIRRYYDVENIRAFWRGKQLDSRGIFNENELEEALVSRVGFPEYVYDFMSQFDSKQERLQNFLALIAAYYREELPATQGFLHAYLTFEREWRLVFVALRAKEWGRDLIKELQFEDPKDPFVKEIIAQKDAEVFVPPDAYKDLYEIYQQHKLTPLQMSQVLCAWRYDKVEEFLGVQFFSLDRILGYLVQLILVEKWFELDREKGEEVVEQSMRG